MTQDYLVILEEDGEGDQIEDEIVLDVRRMRKQLLTHVDVETAVELEVDNTSSGTGLLGLILSILGALTGLLAVFLFATTYPGDWFDAAGAIAGASVRQATAFTAIVGGLLLVAGTALTAYGRRITAQGRLRGFHLVKKTPHAKTELR